MKNIKFIIIAALIVSTFSCSDEFLERKDLYRKSTESYYRTEKDMGEALTGAYSVLPVAKGETNPVLLSMILSDDVLGGGDGAGDAYIRLVDKFQDNSKQDVFSPIWERYYQGIFRVNSIIDNAGNAEYDNPDNLSRDLGEAYFLRAYFYFNLSKFFGKVPLIITPLSGNEPRAEVEKTYAQIASDLKMASEMLPSTPLASMDPARDGHATKWAAESLMGRVFLFYTGTYNKTELPLVEGGAISKADAIKYLEDVRDNSGHSLVPKFPNLWAYSATGLKTEIVGPDGSTVPANKFVSDGGYEWTADTDSDTETIFAYKFNTFASEKPVGYPRANQVVLFCGIRTTAGSSVPHGTGWGYGTVHPNLWDSFDDADIRKHGSMFNVEDDESAALEGTVAANFQANKLKYDGYSVTGVFNKKWMPVHEQTEATFDETRDKWTFKNEHLWVLRGFIFENPTQFCFLRPMPILRYADVLLMHSELTGDVTGINEVRDRAGLGAAADVSTATILNERRHELAFEGQRYWDLMRTGELENAFNTLNASNVKVADGTAVDGEFYKDEYKVDFRMDRMHVQLPESQVALSNGVLEQNPGW